MFNKHCRNTHYTKVVADKNEKEINKVGHITKGQLKIQKIEAFTKMLKKVILASNSPFYRLLQNK